MKTLINSNERITEASSDAPLYRCMTKGVKGGPDRFEYGLAWVTARRGGLKLYKDRLECGDWIVPFEAIQKAVLFETRQCFIPCYVLKLLTKENAYQFGLNGNRFWRSDLPFEVERTKGRLKYSVFSIAVRLALIGGLIWYFYGRSV